MKLTSNNHIPSQADIISSLTKEIMELSDKVKTLQAENNRLTVESMYYTNASLKHLTMSVPSKSEFKLPSFKDKYLFDSNLCVREELTLEEIKVQEINQKEYNPSDYTVGSCSLENLNNFTPYCDKTKRQEINEWLRSNHSHSHSNYDLGHSHSIYDPGHCHDVLPFISKSELFGKDINAVKIENPINVEVGCYRKNPIG